MAIVVFPVDAVTGAPSYTGRMLREAQSVFMAGAAPTDPFGARSGVRPGTSATTVTATSTLWTMGEHAGILDMETAVEAGPYAYAVNTAQTGAVTAADATRPRVDIVWVRLDDPAESDGSSVPAVVAGYTAGAPLASPVAPATPARCMVLATIQVPLSGGGSPTVIWTAPYTVAAGGILPVPAGVYPANPYLGQYIDDPTLGLLRYDGTSWTRASGSNMGAPISTVVAGTTATGTWVQDVYSGSYSFTAVAGRRYRAVLDGLQFSSTVAADKFLIAICNGGAGVATPGAGIVANSYITLAAAGANGLTSVPVAGSFVPGAGPVTLSVNLIRITGTGTGTPSSVPGGVSRDLYAVDLGPA